MRLDEYQIANALIDTRLVMTSRLASIDRRNSSITRNPVVSERPKCGDVKGTIRSVVRYLPVSISVRRHRLISISYISLLPCHGIFRTFWESTGSRRNTR
jgi:hypothetical protein